MTKAADPGKQQAAWRFGWRAEILAAWWLRFKGHAIIARRYRSPAGELDLIARRGSLLIFVEVKARRDYQTAAESISRRQQQRIARAAESFVAHHPRHQNATIRFDVVLIAPGHRPQHIADAWRPEI